MCAALLDGSVMKRDVEVGCEGQGEVARVGREQLIVSRKKEKSRPGGQGLNKYGCSM